VPPRDKPRRRDGYTNEETEQVKALLLTVAVALGDMLASDLCIVGGLVPSLLVDTTRVAGDGNDEPHPGTNDLDIGLALALLDDERYTELSRRLRAEGFAPDENDDGKKTVQRWRMGELNVTIDFLIPPAPSDEGSRRIKNLERGFGALVTPGLELAFDEKQFIKVEGCTLRGEHATRRIPICGPAAFVVLKALALANRGEPKDAYDIVYVVRQVRGGAHAIAARLAEHARHHRDVVARALGYLARDFATFDDIGPRRAAGFVGVDESTFDDDIADAHGYVADLLRLVRELGLEPAAV
jgi:hypothetical protein